MRISPYQLDQIAQVNATLERHTAPRRFIIWRLVHRILKEFGAIAWSLNHRTPSSIENVKILSSRALSRLPEGVIAVVDPG
ncbi:MAG: hypothetical protein KDK65_07845, partial [Chlamydiia bacterium]|nr:hypothetical protein [Chlamydiia bacterium]